MFFVRFAPLFRAAVVSALALACATVVPTHAQAQSSFLLVPDSTGDRVLALDPFDGALINANFIVDPFNPTAGTGHLQTSLNAIPSGSGTILVSDQISDAIFEYSASGTFLRTVVDNTSGLDNIRGIAVSGGDLFVTVGSGIYTGTVQRFQLNGTRVGTFATLPTTGASPFDVLFRAGDVLVSDSASADIERFSLSGAYLGKFVDSNGITNIDFPEQLNLRANGNLLAAGFSAPVGVYEFNGVTGATVNFFQIGDGNRGVYELGNGQILYTDGNSITRYNPSTGTEQNIITGGSFRYIERFDAAADIPEPASLILVAPAVLSVVLFRRRGKS